MTRKSPVNITGRTDVILVKFFRIMNVTVVHKFGIIGYKKRQLKLSFLWTVSPDSSGEPPTLPMSSGCSEPAELTAGNQRFQHFAVFPVFQL